jgi:hypothetical protein
MNAKVRGLLRSEEALLSSCRLRGVQLEISEARLCSHLRVTRGAIRESLS